MEGLLDYAEGNTVLHRMNPLAKLVIAFAICVAAFLTENPIVLVGLLVLDALIGIIGGIPRKTFSLISGLAKIGAFLFVLQVLFVRSGTPMFLFITDDGLRVAFLVVMRLVDATLPLALVLNLTRMNDLTNALVKCAHLPYRYAFTLTTALKFIPVFATEMRSIMEAQMARGVEFDTKNPVHKIQLMLPLCVPLLVTSVQRSGQSALAAESRGFYLRTRASGSKNYPFRACDAAALCASVVTVAVAVML
jgi:energy-coupling factor transport system permease protein